MKAFGILSIFFVLFTTGLSSESGEFQDLIAEKAKIKAEIETKSPPGQVIFAAQSVTPKLTPSATKVIEAVEIVATPTPEPKPRKSKRDDHHEKDQESDDEEEEKPVSKQKKDNRRKSNKKDKKSSSESNESDDEGTDDVDELPKRLFRPRFRAESSANAIKMFSSTTLLVTLSISLMAVYLI